MRKILVWLAAALSSSALQAAELDSASLRAPLASVEVAGKSLSLTLGPGSGLAHAAGSPWSDFYSVSDRGPNIPCKDSGKVLGRELCPATDVIFPLPAYTPSIYPLQVDGDRVSLRGQAIPLHAANGTPLTGLPPQLPNGERPLGSDLQPLPYSANGVDTECIAALAKGGFWVGEEYGPSLLRVTADGVVRERLVPKGSESDYAGSAIPVRAVLPPLLARRALNRGFEGMALAPEQTRLFVALQSPLANPSAEVAKASRNDRLIVVGLDAEGNFARMEGGYLLQFPDINDFAPGLKQKALKLSAMSAVDAQRVLILLQAGPKVAVYLANLRGATNLLGGTWAKPETQPSLEALADPVHSGIQPVQLQLLWQGPEEGFPKNLGKIEGMSLVDGKSLLLISDNDFAIDGAQTTVWQEPLSAAAQRMLQAQ